MRFEDDQSMKITDDDFVKVESSKSGGAKILKPRSGSFPSEISASTVGSLADIPLATNGMLKSLRNTAIKSNLFWFRSHCGRRRKLRIGCS